MTHRASYTTLDVRAQLAPAGEELDLDWAASVGDATAVYEFEIGASEPTDGLVGIQAFDVGDYGHEIEVNGVPLSGFDIPPGDGWRYWVDTVSDGTLREGINTLRVRRNADADDAFAVGTVVVHWKAPVTDDSSSDGVDSDRR